MALSGSGKAPMNDMYRTLNGAQWFWQSSDEDHVHDMEGRSAVLGKL